MEGDLVNWQVLRHHWLAKPVMFPIGAVGGAAKYAGETALFAGVITADAGEHIG